MCFIGIKEKPLPISQMKPLFVALVTLFSTFFGVNSLRAEWQWHNDMVVPKILPDGYEARFSFENKGKESVTVIGLTFSCACTVYHFQATSAKPGKTGVLTVRIPRHGDDDLGKDFDFIA
ncbi:MAG TPA: DUF1573 domain-containing protein, partial [Candidatus Methylacidiphilales bacterium]